MTVQNINDLVSKCTDLIRTKFHPQLDTSVDIKADCDAFSFVVSFDPHPSPQLIDSLKNFLCCFGTELSQVTLPAKPVSNKTYDSDRKDKIFGSDFVRSSVLGNLLYQAEVQVVDSPVKISIHKSCRQPFKQALDGLGCPIDTTEHPGLCFNKNSTSNLPCYRAIVDTLLSDATLVKLPTSNFYKHIFHIGNIGTRMVIHPVSPDCVVQRMFRLVEIARQKGAFIELTQIDVAINAPAPTARLPRFSRNLQDCSPLHVFHQCNTDVWPLHDILYSAVSNNVSPVEQIGTVRFRHAPASSISIVRNVDEIHQSSSHSNCSRPLTNIYQDLISSQDTPSDQMDSDFQRRSHLSFDMKSIYSTKAYSTISHFNSRYKRYIPLDEAKTRKLPTESIVTIQRLLHRLGDLLEKTFLYVSHNGVCGRIELSIRPQIHSEPQLDLRTKGNFVDVLSHVYLGLYDSLYGKNQLSLDVELTYQPVSFRCLEIIESIQQIVRFRAQTTFDQVYKSVDMHIWLRAMIYLVTTLIGLTHDKKIDPLQKWLAKCRHGCNSHDPLHLCHRLTNHLSVLSDEVPLEPTPQPYDELNPKILAIITHSLGAEEACHSDILKLIEPQHTAEMMFINLSMKNKLIIAQKLTSELIPNLSQLLSADSGSEDNEQDNEQDNEVANAGNNFRESHFSNHEDLDYAEYISDRYGRTLNSHRLYAHMHANMTNSSTTTSLQLLNQDVDSDSPTSVFVHEFARPTHPVLLLISKLCDIHRYIDIRSPLFFLRFKVYIQMYCRYTSNDTESHSLMLEDTHTSLCKFARAIKLTIPRGTSKDHVIQIISSAVFFPCDGADFGSLDMIPDGVDSWVNTVYREISSFELPPKKPTHRRYYRDVDNTNIEIPIVVTVIQPSNMENMQFVSECTTDPLNLFTPDRQLILDHLNDLSDKVLCNQFLNCNGTNNYSFHQSSSLNDLYPHLGFDQGQSPNDDIVFPIISRMIQKPVSVYDPVANSASLHLYDNGSKKVISYQINHCDWIYTRECIIIMKFVRDGVKIYTEMKRAQHHCSSHIDTQRSTILNDNSSRFKNVMKFTDHPYKQVLCRGRHLHRFPALLYKLLTQNNVRHPSFARQGSANEIDPLEMFNYLSEISQFDLPIEAIMSDSVIESFRHHSSRHSHLSLASMPDLVTYLVEPAHQSHAYYFTVFTPFFCLQYKLWICVWLFDSSKRKTSHFYWYDPRSQKVELIITQSLSFHRDHKQFLYVLVKLNSQHGVQSTSYYEMPTDNVYNNQISSPIKFNVHRHLKCRLSYVDQSTIKLILQKLAQVLDLHTVFHEEHTPYLLPASMKITSVVYPYKTEDTNLVTQFTVLVIYPIEPAGYKAICFHRDLNQETLSPVTTAIAQRALHGRVDSHIPCLFCNFNDLCGDSEPVCSGYYVIFIIYLTYIANNHESFMTVVMFSSTLDDLGNRLTFWLESIVADQGNLNAHRLPEWFMEIYLAIRGNC